MSPKEIAEEVLLPDEKRPNYYGEHILELARSFLELEKEKSELEKNYISTVNRHLSEIARLKTFFSRPSDFNAHKRAQELYP